MSDEPRLTLQVNLDAVFGELNCRLQRCIDMVCFGIRAIPSGPTEPTTYPLNGAWFHVVTAEGYALKGEPLRQAFMTWILTNGSRDAVEVLSTFLERANMAAAAYSTWERFRIPGTRDARVPSAEWNGINAKADKFHRLGLPDKLDRLRECSPSLAPELSDEVRAINQARNCMVHRAGVVTERDLNTADGLLVKWEKVSLEIDGPSGRQPLQPPQYVAEGGNLVMNYVRTSKLFRLGEPISFSEQEFAELCMTFVRFGNDLCMRLSNYGLSTGFIASPSDSAG